VTTPLGLDCSSWSVNELTLLPPHCIAARAQLMENPAVSAAGERVRATALTRRTEDEFYAARKSLNKSMCG